MIPRTIPHWQTALASACRDPRQLLEHLQVDPRGLDWVSVPGFDLRVPWSYVRRMRPRDPRDPLLLQVLPREPEFRSTPGFLLDPVGDRHSEVVPGLLHKYRGRVLLITTGACPVHCRYCFRRHFPYGQTATRLDEWDPALAHIQANPGIREVILSGGDPFSLSDDRLQALVRCLEAIPHLLRVRLHTRMPVVLPERVDDKLQAWIAATRLQTVIVLHANHPNEIDHEVRDAARRLRDTGTTLLNQSVLLAGINDSAATLGALSEALFAAGVLPYYLHQLDPVQGAAHFRVPDSAALRIHGELQRSLPGYLVPRLVREVPGAPAKVPLDAGPGAPATGCGEKPPAPSGFS